MGTVMVTGGAGYVGGAIARALLRAGEKVVIVDNFSTGVRGQVPVMARLIDASVGESRIIAEVIRSLSVTSIIHCAASLSVPESVEKPTKYYRNNVAETIALLDAAAYGGVEHIVFSSTAAVYGNTLSGTSVPEDALLSPLSPYGHSKRMAEQILTDTCRAFDMASVILRYFNVAGADPEGNYGYPINLNTQHLVRSAILVALGKREYLEVYGTDYPTRDGTCERDFIHVTDLAHAHRAALRYLEEGGESTILNCGYGSGYSVLGVIKTVESVSGTKIPVRYAPRREGDPAIVVANIDRVRDTLEWSPQYSLLSEMVRHELAWVRTHLAEPVV